MKKELTSCDKCGQIIHFREAHVSISRYVEVSEYSISRRRIETQPIDAVNLMTLCARCGNIFNVENLKKLIKVLMVSDSKMN